MAFTKAKFEKPLLYRVYCVSRGMWWNGNQFGYTSTPKEFDAFSYTVAKKIIDNSKKWGNSIEEIAIPVDVPVIKALIMLKRKKYDFDERNIL